MTIVAHIPGGDLAIRSGNAESLVRAFASGTTHAAGVMIRAAIIAACIAAPAAAKEQCFSSAIGYLVLAEQHGEARRFLGVTPGGIAVELWMGPSGGWTLLKTNSHGVSCIIATGKEGEMYYGAAGIPG